jgi:7-carboxy-7-deazaguanine synthase
VNNIRISEIFHSLQGESTRVGLPTVFVRLTGCPLRCYYCDTEYAFTGGEILPISAILEQVTGYKMPYVCVTGGEPLAQQSCFALLTQLCDEGYQVSLETSGALSVEAVDSRVKKIMDIKTPDSGEAAKNHWPNLDFIRDSDELKFVICSREDYEWTKDIVDTYQLFECCEVLLSPSHAEIDSTVLAEWMLADRLPARFQVQLHKYLWNDEAGR